MKRCPTCERTFDDTLTFCLVDGAVLSPPFDPEATVQMRSARETEEQITVLSRSGARLLAREQGSTTSRPKKPWVQLILALIAIPIISLIIGLIAAFFSAQFGVRGAFELIAWTAVLVTFIVLLTMTFRWWRKATLST